MLVECKNCGAPLDVNGVERFVRCSYCDKVNRVRTMRTMAVQTPPTWAPPPTWQPPPQFGPFRPFTYHPVRAPLANRLPWLALGFLALAMLAGTCVVVGIAGRGGPPRSAFPHLDLIQTPRPAPQIVLSTSLVRTAPCSAPSAEPQLRLRTTRPTIFAIRPTPPETVLILQRGNRAPRCSDEGGADVKQGLTGSLDPGTYQLWALPGVGRVEGPVSLDIRAAGDLVRATASPELGSLTDITLESRRESRVVGTVDAHGIERSCGGFVSAPPQLAIDLREGRRIAVALEQHTDELFVMVRTRDHQVRCSSYPPGVPTEHVFDLPRGRNTLWVGARELTAESRYAIATRASD